MTIKSATPAHRRRIRIRRCRPIDVATVLELWKRTGIAPSVTDSALAIRRRLRHDDGLFYLAWDGPRLVGSLIGGWDGWRGSMARLAVDPDYRRHGIAQALVQRVEKKLRALGAIRISAIVLENNAGGRAFWSSVAYRMDTESLRYIRDLR